jgi:hypothetical protein
MIMGYNNVFTLKSHLLTFFQMELKNSRKAFYVCTIERNTIRTAAKSRSMCPVRPREYITTVSTLTIG